MLAHLFTFLPLCYKKKTRKPIHQWIAHGSWKSPPGSGPSVRALPASSRCPARCSAPHLLLRLREHPVPSRSTPCPPGAHPMPCRMPRTHPLGPIMARLGTRGRGQEVFLLEYLVWACIPSFTTAKLQPCVFTSGFCINTEGIFFQFFFFNLI